jgi:hypothetical protein
MHLDRIACAREADLSVAASHSIVYDSRHGTAPYMGQFRIGIGPEDVGGWENFKTWTKVNNPGWISMTNEGEAVLGVSSARIDDFIQHDLGFVPHPCAVPTDMRIFTNPAP